MAKKKQTPKKDDAAEEILQKDETAGEAPAEDEASKAAEEAQAPQTDESAEKIRQLEADLEASKQAHIRTLAEYDNYRKRSVREKEGIYTDAKVVCLGELLPILDNFDRALGVTESDFESYKKGVEMIYTSFCETLKKLGVEAFGEEGETFDPNIHNGVMHVEDEALGENVIAQVFSKGYRIGDKILRPAMVKVAN